MTDSAHTSALSHASYLASVIVLLCVSCSGVAAADVRNDTPPCSSNALSGVLRTPPGRFLAGVFEIVDASECIEPTEGSVCRVGADVVLRIGARGAEYGNPLRSGYLKLIMPVRRDERAPMVGDRVLAVITPDQTIPDAHRPIMLSVATRDHAKEYLRTVQVIAPDAIEKDVEEGIEALGNGWSLPVEDLNAYVVAKAGSCQGHRTASTTAASTPVVSAALLQCGNCALPTLTDIVSGSKWQSSPRQCLEEPNACRLWAIRAIGEIGSPQARGLLLHLLQSEDNPYVLGKTMEVLGTLGEYRVKDACREALLHSDGFVRAEAVWTLGKLGSRQDVEAMLVAVMTLDVEYLERGVGGLVLLGDQRALPALEKLMATSKEPFVAEKLRESIAQIRARALTASEK